MALVNKIRTGFATYWEKTGNNDAGEPIYAAPIQLRVRWEDVVEEYLDKDGRKLISRARIFVDREIPIGSAIRETKLTETADLDNPFNNSDTWEIRQYSRIRNRKYTKTLQWVML